jgi:hypothetical protein
MKYLISPTMWDERELKGGTFFRGDRIPEHDGTK